MAILYQGLHKEDKFSMRHAETGEHHARAAETADRTHWLRKSR